MFKIVNNKFMISRGESATVDIEIRGTDSKPYLIPAGLVGTQLHFKVQNSTFKGSQVHIDMTFINITDNLPAFEDLEIETLEAYYFDQTYPNTEPLVLMFDLSKVYNYGDEYKYLVLNEETDEYEWVEYKFQIMFNIDPDHTKDLDQGVYTYEFMITADNFKKSLVKGEFIVEGSTYNE